MKQQFSVNRRVSSREFLSVSIRSVVRCLTAALLLSGWGKPALWAAADPVRPVETTNQVVSGAVLKQFKASWQNSSTYDPVASATVEWNGRTLEYTAMCRSPEKPLKRDRRSLRPSEAVWKEFWKDMDQDTIWSWIGSYGAGASSDGRSWSLEIEWGNKKLRTKGENRFPCMTNVNESTDSPVMFYRLQGALDKLVAVPVEATGEYIAGFEASNFRPTKAPYKGQVWWLTPNKDFVGRYGKLTPADSETYGFRIGPTVMVRARGRLAGPGRYGHLNGYPFEFFVEEVLEMKKLR